MTSGTPATVTALAEDLGRAMREISEAVDLLAYAADQPNWDSHVLRLDFNRRAWATRAAAQVSYIRLNRAKLAVEKAVSAYRTMETDATTGIEWWRRAKREETNGFFLWLARLQVLSYLAIVAEQFGTALEEAREFVQTDPLSGDQEAWLKNGLLRSMDRDLQNPTDPGPIIPGTLLTGDDDGMTKPQGLGLAPNGDLIQTGYNNDGQAVLSIFDPETGELKDTVNLGAPPDDSPYPDQPGVPPDHAGGVSVDENGTVWVTSSGDPPQVYPYDLDQIEGTPAGDEVPPSGEVQTLDDIPGAAYSTIENGTMYVGTFGDPKQGEMWTYRQDSTGTWVQTGGPYPTPPKTQGVALRGDHIVFSTSHGRENGSQLLSYPTTQITGGDPDADPDSAEETVDLPNMSEGVVPLPDGFATTYESGANEFDHPLGDDPLESLWASMNLTVTPYSDLGLAGGFDVEPATLERASRLFDDAEAGLDAVAGRVRYLNVPAGSLGGVDEAAVFLAAINAHTVVTSDWIDEGRISAGITASGLVGAARTYTASDTSSGSLFDRLLGLVPGG